MHKAGALREFEQRRGPDRRFSGLLGPGRLFDGSGSGIHEGGDDKVHRGRSAMALNLDDGRLCRDHHGHDLITQAPADPPQARLAGFRPGQAGQSAPAGIPHRQPQPPPCPRPASRRWPRALGSEHREERPG